MAEYQRCKRCVMDNFSDKTITFDENGFCNYCTEQLERKDKIYFPNNEGKNKLEKLLDEIRKEGWGKKYDCIMGISGGLDSSYLMYLGHKWKLRILAVHVDDGFDTEISKNNINKLSEACDTELVVIKPDPEQFNDLTRSYILANVPNIAVPQDNILFAEIYRLTRKFKIKYFLSGGNFALECILQKGNTFPARDVVNIKDIHKKYGTKPIDKLCFMSDIKMLIYEKFYGIKTFRPLNLIEYNRNKALKELNDFCDFQYYGSKHLENSLTEFIQTYWFYNKYGVDKRKSHLSSMIVSNQMTREEALNILKEPVYQQDIMEIKINNILEQLDLDREHFDQIMKIPAKQHTDYKTSKISAILRFGSKTARKMGIRK